MMNDTNKGHTIRYDALHDTKNTHTARDRARLVEKEFSHNSSSHFVHRHHAATVGVQTCMEYRKRRNCQYFCLSYSSSESSWSRNSCSRCRRVAKGTGSSLLSMISKGSSPSCCEPCLTSDWEPCPPSDCEVRRMASPMAS